MAQGLGPPLLAPAFVRTRGGPAGTGDKGRREGARRGCPLLGPSRTGPGGPALPAPREQRGQPQGDPPGPHSPSSRWGKRGAGGSAPARNGTERDAPGPGSFVLSPTRSTRCCVSRGAQHGRGGAGPRLLPHGVRGRGHAEPPRAPKGAAWGCAAGAPREQTSGAARELRCLRWPRGPGAASWLLWQPPRPRALLPARQPAAVLPAPLEPCGRPGAGACCGCSGVWCSFF